MAEGGKFPGCDQAPNLGRYKHETRFCVGQQVLLDNDPEIRVTVVGIVIHAGGTDYKVAYLHNGVCYEPQVDAFRLYKAG